MGRPKLVGVDRRDVPIHVLTTKGEREELQQAAAAASMSVSTWMRAVSLERARAQAAEKAKQEAK